MSETDPQDAPRFGFVDWGPPPDLKQRELIFDSLSKIVHTPNRSAQKGVFIAVINVHFDDSSADQGAKTPRMVEAPSSQAGVQVIMGSSVESLFGDKRNILVFPSR